MLGGGIFENKKDDLNIGQLGSKRLKGKNEQDKGIYLNVNGIVEWGSLVEEDNLLIKYQVALSNGWEVVDGHIQGVSQKSNLDYQVNQRMVWNMPIEFVIRGESALGWPQLVVVLYGFDFFGRSVVKAYGTIHIPPQQGTHHTIMHLFTPFQTSTFAQVIEYFFGSNAEITHPIQLLAFNNNRHNLKTKTAGQLKLQFKIQIHDNTNK